MHHHYTLISSADPTKPSDSLYETIFSKFLYESGISKMLALADFYHVSTDYLLCRTELREHTNKSVSDLHLNNDAIQILTWKSILMDLMIKAFR